MRYIERQLERQVLKAAKGFPAVVPTGPRRAGNTLLLRRLFPKAGYFLLEDPDVVARLRADWASTRRQNSPARRFAERCSKASSQRKY